MKYTIKIKISSRLWGYYKKDSFYLHRENNSPAVEYRNGDKYYWKNGREYYKSDV